VTSEPGTGPPLVTVEAVVSGRVQKVGFRACIRKIALEQGITGVVMNRDDGTVLIRATGEPVILEKFVSMIYGCPRAVVRHIDLREIGFVEFHDFFIRRVPV
jgi:acylphosphatase